MALGTSTYGYAELPVLTSAFQRLNSQITLPDVVSFYDNVKSEYMSALTSGQPAPSWPTLVSQALTSASQITLNASGVAVFRPVFQMAGLAEADLPNTVSRIQQAVDGELSGAKALTLALGMTRFTYPSQSELTLPLTQGSQDYNLVALNTGEALNSGLVQWNSSDSTVASFTSGTGTLTLKKNGWTTITASVNGYVVQQFTVTVGTPLTATVKSITVDGNPVQNITAEATLLNGHLSVQLKTGNNLDLASAGITSSSQIQVQVEVPSTYQPITVTTAGQMTTPWTETAESGLSGKSLISFTGQPG